MLKRVTLGTNLFALAAAAAALAPHDAGAAVFKDTGWVQLQLSASDSASTTIAGYDFGIGYSAHLGLEAYNWDVAPNIITVSCVTMLVDMGMFTFPIQLSQCPTLPGTPLSESTVNTNTTYAGHPAVRKTTTVIWNVPDSGAQARAEGFLRVPATLFDHDFDAFKLTAAAIGNSQS